MSANNSNTFKDKLIKTLACLLLIKLIGIIRIPVISNNTLNIVISSNPLIELFNILSGDSFRLFSISCLGIIPIINSNIIVNLLSSLLPILKNLKTEGKYGKDRLDLVTDILSVVISLCMAMGVTVGLANNDLLVNSSFRVKLLVVLTLVTGVILVNLITKLISKIGLIDGVNSVVLMNTFISTINGFRHMLFTNARFGWVVLTLFIFIIYSNVIYNLIIVTYKLPVHIASHKSTKYSFRELEISYMNFATSSIIFTNVVLGLPSILHLCYPNNNLFNLLTLSRWSPFNSNGLLYYLVYAVLIVLFYVYTSYINYDTEEMANEFQQNNIIVTGVIPGNRTNKFLRRVINKHSFRAGLITAILNIVSLVLNIFLPNNTIFNLQTIFILMSILKDLKFKYDAQTKVNKLTGFLISI